MTERKAYTDEQKAEIKRRRDERNAAVKALIDLVLKDSDASQDMKDLALIAKPKTSAGSGVSRTSVMSTVADLFKDGDAEVDEITIFTELHYGRSEMNTAIKNLIKKPKPEDRVWIRFDVENGLYVLEGLGAEAPEGWTGYIPVEEVIADDSDEDEADDE